MDTHHHLSTLLLPVVTGLLFEELTFGGLVRLLIAPLPRRCKQSNRKTSETCPR